MTEVNAIDLINEFNRKVIISHNSHYKNNPQGLIEYSRNASPNGNQIYHLYSNGEITYQKGAWVYLQRTEFNMKYEVECARSMPFQFVKKASNNTTYAILTEEETLAFREEMKKIITTINKII